MFFLRNRAYTVGIFCAGCARSGIASCYMEDNSEIVVLSCGTYDRSLSLKRFHYTRCDSLDSIMGRQSYSSQAGTESSGEKDDDLGDGFLKLETPASATVTQESNMEDENKGRLISGSELSGVDDNDDNVEELQNKLELSDTETDVSQNRYVQKRDSLGLFKAILATPGLSVHNVLDKWVEEGKCLNKQEVATAMFNLRKHHMYGMALQLSEWLESSKRLDFHEKDYASHVDLIAKLRGIERAEKYVENIPKSFRGELIYRALLGNCIITQNVKQAEEIFKKMQDLKVSVSSFTCNQLLLLYKKTDKKKLADVLLFMEKENLKPTLFTYGVLIDAKGQSKDITGMDHIFETMKAEGIEPDINTQCILAKHYVSGGFTEKTLAILKEMEGGNLKQNRKACQTLLPLYASIGKADEVRRIWEVCSRDPSLGECMAAVEAWGKLKMVEEAELVFNRMLKKKKKPSSKHYSVLLRVYVDHKMLAKGKDLVKRMEDSGCSIGPLTWDALVKLYVEAGEAEKAESILLKADQQNHMNMKPMLSSYILIMDQYAKRGDVHNAEKMFQRMRQVGYVSRLQQFQSLVKAYVNAGSPAYGMWERMKADNVFPNKLLAGMLAQVDAFSKNVALDLLE